MTIVDSGRAVNSFTRLPQGKRVRVPSVAKRRTCSSSWPVQVSAIASERSRFVSRNVRIANSAVRRDVNSASRAIPSSKSDSEPLRVAVTATASVTGQIIQPVKVSSESARRMISAKAGRS